MSEGHKSLQGFARLLLGEADRYSQGCYDLRFRECSCHNGEGVVEECCAGKGKRVPEGCQAICIQAFYDHRAMQLTLVVFHML